MTHLLNYPWLFGVLFASLLAAVLEIGRRISMFARLHGHAERREQITGIRDGLFVLVSLLAGFTMTFAANCYFDRRSLASEDAISIRATYHRAATLPEPYREHSQTLLREYVATRLKLGTGVNIDTINRSRSIQNQLWADAVAVAEFDRTDVTSEYINSLNKTTDVHEKRIVALENRVPITIWSLLVCVSLIAVFARGLTLISRSWVNMLLVPFTIAVVVALIADLDTPGGGFIRIQQRAMQRLDADLKAESPHQAR